MRNGRASSPASDPIPYRDRLPELQQIVQKQGSLGLLLIDISGLSPLERQYGSGAFTKMRTTTRDLLLGLRGTDVRTSDVLAIDEKGGDAFLVFLSPKRHDGPMKVTDLRRAAERVERLLNEKLRRLRANGLAEPHEVEVVVGFSLVLDNPLVMPERLVARLVEEARDCVRMHRHQRDLLKRRCLQELLLEDKLTTLFQPIVELMSRAVLGFEALSRGPAGTAYHMPLTLFEMASSSDLLFELDRKCRHQALQAARRLPAGTLLFVNVLPSAMYDPTFRGAAVVELLGELGLQPDRVVLEITEKSAIENYAGFAKALDDFTELGFQIAVDDVGAGYSGLEKIAHLNPRYLKLDGELVRGIDSSYIRREMARALTAFADKIGATIIAEGIEREAELRVLVDLGIGFGQGYLLGRPASGMSVPQGPSRTLHSSTT
jgi:EAL domain-containing protein (putative c-di-GMP-specific phosphodiesterase class I)